MTSASKPAPARSAPPAPSPAEYASALRRELVARADIFEALLPPGADLDRYVELVVQAVVENPDLLRCSVDSVILAVREAAAYGLEPTGLYGGAYLVPRWNSRTSRMEATFQISYRGLLQLVLATGRIRAVEVQLVRAKDVFRVAYVDGRTELVHEPLLNGEDPGDVIAGYARVHFSDGLVIVPRPMTRAAIEKVARASGTIDNPNSPWRLWWEQMALKTVLRDALRFIPLSPAAERAIQNDLAADRPLPPEARAGEGRSSRTRQLQERLRARLALPEASQAATDGPGATEMSAVGSEASPPNEDALGAESGGLCGHVATDPLMAGSVCELPAGHPGAHRATGGSWPR
jgi:recombination protein RecT